MNLSLNGVMHLFIIPAGVRIFVQNKLPLTKCSYKSHLCALKSCPGRVIERVSSRLFKYSYDLEVTYLAATPDSLSIHISSRFGSKLISFKPGSACDFRTSPWLSQVLSPNLKNGSIQPTSSRTTTANIRIHRLGAC